MIAASDPQEFVPSGRQQTSRHPGPSDKFTSEIVNKIHLLDKFDSILLDKLEKVSLIDTTYDNEWWTLRKPSEILGDSESCDNTPLQSEKQKLQPRLAFTKSFFDYLDDNNIKPSRISDSILRKFKDNLSTGSEDLRSTSNTNVEAATQKKSEEFSTKTKAGCIEEELYVKGHTVVWSRGIMNSIETSNNTKKIICSFTSTSPIKSILWCNFCLERPSYSLDTNNSDTFHSVKVPSLCVVDCQNIRVFTEKGEDFEVATPFLTSAIWSTAHGILIEKEIENDSKDISFGGKALLYSLAYPLDDICPVVVNQGSCLQFFNNPSFKIVFTSENPSICVIFDSQTKLHSVYRIRKIRTEERDFYEKSIGYVSSIASSSAKLKSRLSIWENNQSNTRSPIGKANSLQSFHLHSKSQSSMATISRCQSPMTSATSSPQMSMLSSVINPSQIHERSQSIFDSSRSMISMKQYPLICLDYVWTEPNTSGGPASKIFICDDLAGQSYFCYIASSKLFMVKADFSTSNIIFGSINSISAKDATPLPHLRMLAILEHNNNVSLYSGMSVIGKMHVSGTLVKHTPTPCERRFQSQINSPFPRRSSMLPNCNQVDPQFDENLFSPVLPHSSSKPSKIFQITLNPEESVTLIGLRDPIENRLTLHYSDGTFFRIMLPLLATSPLVENCLNVLKQCLQREALMTFFTRWYSTRNSMGTQNFTNEQEWEMFITLLYELLGYEEEHVSETFEEGPPTPSMVAKKRKQSPIGCDDDWQYLFNSKLATNSDYVDSLLNITPTAKSETTNVFSKHVQINKNSILFPYIKIIHFSFHLLYEDFKLNILKNTLLEPLAVFLNKLSNDLNMIDYSIHYWKDFPEKCMVNGNSGILPNDLAQDTNICSIAYEGVLNIMQHLSDLMNGKRVINFPYLKYVNERSRDFVELCAVVSTALKNEYSDESDKFSSNTTDQASTTLNDVVLLMTQMKISTKVLDTLPFGLYLYLYNSIWKCREYPPANWPPESYLLIWREDLASQTMKMKKNRAEPSVDKFDIGNNNQLHDIGQPESECLDGMEDIDTSFMKLRFPDDVRVTETRKMLQSSKPVPIALVQIPDISDHDFIEEQEKYLYAVCTRTMALPVARGMFTLRTATPLITKPLPIPQLCLSGKSSPRGTTVELTHIDTPSNMSLWPLFHNGVANGLRISPDASNIDSTWIVFNKPKLTEKQMEHGGFLLALGLHGHLKNLDVWNTFDYLAKHHEMISVGILLGLACAFRGTGHTAVTKALSIHVEALLPPTSMELDLSQPLQVTALLGIGLLYQGTSHSHMTEVLLSEIGRPPGPEMENSSDRESYSLAAGLALGLVTLQRGGKSGLNDLNVSDTLHYYMTGGTKRPFTGAQRDKYKVSSFQIREGTSVNLDVTAPGATLALGLMYLGTHNKTIADWMSPPETQYLLDFIRPDFLMLRIISKSLILWNNIEPSKEWIEAQVPKNIRPFCMVQPSPLMDIDYEAMNQAYCNIISGACFAIGLRYAGSADEDAFRTLLHYCHMFISLTGKSISELAGKPTIETCLNVLLLSVAMIMAGTGNLEVMRLVRHLRKRVGISSSAVVTYGSHLAIHMALGLLFLGGGRYTLSNSPSSVAALVCAFYPKFPTHSNDNRYHLQAFRHLYVLAAETRLVIPRDVYLGKSCYANLRIVKTDGSMFTVRAPAMLPDLNSLAEIAVDDERYWKIIFRKDRNWSTLNKILSANGYIDVKQRAGCLSYIVDKFGYHSQFARTLTQSMVSPWNPSSSSIKNFTSNQSVKYFCDNFLSYDATEFKECNLKKLFTKITYDAVVMDKLIVLPAFAAIRKMIEDMDYQPSSIQLWQFKLVLNQIQSCHSCDILSSEMILGIKEEISNCLEAWESTLKPHLQKYLNENIETPDSLTLRRLAAYITFFDIPHSIKAAYSPILVYMQHLHTNYPAYTISKMLNLIEI
ncbi:hypothetical protein WA026_007405 [Henosepilachna vigintioctopunctata]|uniref:Anaphase-promoting complex subunit 1 n=1 Tax=Henosepilachna vigintioctopunctata TaxID=420089 RepID=A0AAW1UM36_9CUCU